MSLTITTEHYDRVNNFRVDDVMFNLKVRPEKLYPMQKFTPDMGTIWDVSHVPPEKNRFNSVEEALVAVRKWCR